MPQSPAGSGRRATLTSVADRAGVSRQTVSNVLHTPEVVQPRTRDRVLAAIAELDYRPNLAARQMRTSRSQAVAVRIQPSRDGVNSVVLDRFMHALCRAAEERLYHLVVFTAADDAAEISMYAHLRSTLNIDGFVLVGTHAGDHRVGWLVEQEIPFVAFGRPWFLGRHAHSSGVDSTAQHSWVDVDGAVGTYQATRHLLAAGHHRIAFLGWDESAGVGDDREHGWRRALEEAGPTQDPVVLRGTDDIVDGVAMAEELYRSHPEITAAVCVSDSLAIGAWRASRSADHRLSLVGFDNSAAAQALGLSSVAQPLEPAARRCFDLLYAAVTATDPHAVPHARLLLEPRLFVRTDIPAIPAPSIGPDSGKAAP